MRRFAKWIGIPAALAMALFAAPGSASAAGWRGGGGGGAPAHAGAMGGGHAGGYAPAAHAVPAAGWHGGAYAQNGWRGGYAPAPGYRGYRNTVVPAAGTASGQRARLVPGYWGWSRGVRVWVGGSWALQPCSGWLWVAPRAWNGYSWVSGGATGAAELLGSIEFGTWGRAPR
jgi:hypothetical protein